MKKKEGQRILQQLAQQSDVMIENYVPGALAGSRGWAKSFLKIPYPLKIFVLMYKNILIYKSFYFEAPYYGSHHRPHLPYSAPYSYY